VFSTGNTPSLAGCLRNSRAVAQAAQETGGTIAVIPAGERWEDGSFRPALDDLLGAGAIIHYLRGTRSVEAEAAQTVFLHFRERLAETLAACGSGKEAADHGILEDVRMAADLNASLHAPRLVDGAFISGN
jgi:2-phosphosulfolactate phosphatase